MVKRNEWGSYADWMLYQIDVEHMECIMMGRYWAVLHHSVMDAWDLLTDAATPEEARRKAVEAYANFKGCKLPWAVEEKTFKLLSNDDDKKMDTNFKVIKKTEKLIKNTYCNSPHMYIRARSGTSIRYDLNVTKDIREVIGLGNKLNIFIDTKNKKIALKADENGIYKMNTNGIVSRIAIQKMGITKPCYLYPCDAGEYDFCFDYSDPEYIDDKLNS